MRLAIPPRSAPAVPPGQEPEVFRGAGAPILSLLWAVVALVILIDLAVQGRGHSAVVAALLVLAISGIIYACAWRPRVISAPDGVTVVNPLRDYRVPWAAVEDVELAYSLRLRCAPPPGGGRGKVISSWAMQSNARPRSRRDLMSGYAQRRAARPQSGYRSAPVPRPRYAHPDVAEAMSRTPAQYALSRLQEGARKAQSGATAGTAQPAAGQPEAAGPAQAGFSARWAWLSIVVMAVPLAAFLAAALL